MRKLLLAGLIVLVAAGLIWSRNSRRPRRFPKRTTTQGQVRKIVPVELPDDVETPVAIHLAGHGVRTTGDFHRWMLETFRGKSDRQRLDAVFELGKRLGAEDFDSGFALLEKIPEETIRSVFTSGIFFARGQSLGAEAMAEIKEGRPEFKRFDDAFAQGGAIVGWASADPRAAFAWAKDESNRDLASLAFAAWGDIDAALKDAHAMPEGVGHFLDWAKEDPERAMDFAMGLDEAVRPAVVDRIAQGWASHWSDNYRADFFVYLYIAVQGNHQSFADRSIYRWWSQYEPAQAVESAEAEQNEGAEEALHYWLQSDPDRAIEWMKSRSVDFSILHSLSEMGNPEAAARVYEAMPNPSTNALHWVADSWMKSDPEAAFAWLTTKQLSSGEMLDAAKTAAANLWAWDRDAASIWAQQLTDPGVRAQALAGIAEVEEP